MQTQKMSFSIKDVLSREEMKSIMAGSNDGNGTCKGCSNGQSFACGGSAPLCSCKVSNPTVNNC